MKFLLNVFFVLLAFSISAQENFNMELIAEVDLGENGNDIWGYVASDSTEYAVVGSSTATQIFSLEDPTAPSLVVSIPGPASIWRDMKDWNDHIYVTTDQGGTTEGLLIIDMSNVQDTVTWSNWKPFIDHTDSTGHQVTGQLTIVHNLYIDENGICYLAGVGGVGNRGVVMLDLNQDPKNPVVVGIEDEFYAHDAYARGDTLYASEILANPGQLTMYDVSDKGNVIKLGSVVTSFSFCHNTWISDDGKYAFTTDERANANVDSYDISDPTNIKRLDEFHPLATSGNEVIPHNTHYLDGYLITSWYTDGIVITDVCDPEKIIEVGHYDTFDGPHGGFNGCWGAYPFLPSGLVLASNINTPNGGNGTLTVFRPTYQRASRVEGIITDVDDGSPVNDVEIEILNTKENRAFSKADGSYKAGVADVGSFQVRYTHPDYEEVVINVQLNSGCNAVNQPLQMQRLTTGIVTGVTVLDTDGSPIPNSEVILTNEARSYNITTDANGGFSEEIILGDYAIYAGAWGYRHAEIGNLTVEVNNEITIEMPRGYQDDFLFDLGWTVSGDAETGDWERGVPVAIEFNGNLSSPDVDIDSDLGDECYITDNTGGQAGANDIDDGETNLISDVMDLTWYTGPTMEYHLWFFNGGGAGGQPGPNDTLSVYIDNGLERVLLEQVTEAASIWRPKSSFFLADYIDITDNMTAIFVAGDYLNGHIVESAVDAFQVIEGMSSSVEDIEGLENVMVLPNPFEDKLSVRVEAEDNREFALRMYNINGQLVASKNNIKAGLIDLDTNVLARGTYIIQLTDGQASSYHKVIKQ